MRRLLLVLLVALALLGSACAGDDGTAAAGTALAEANVASSEATAALADARAASVRAEAALEAAVAAQTAADAAHLTAEGNQEAVAAAESALEVAQRAADEARDQAAAAQSEADAAREAAQAAQDEAAAQAAAAAERAEAEAEAAAEPAEEPVEEPALEEEPVEAEPAPEAALLPVDPEVHIGTLDNGLTYYIRNNEEPGSNLSLRLAVNAGAVNEPAPHIGLAHFLEHMMFNGTDEYPRNEIIEALRELGVEFGPDINAYTSYDETVYMLDVVTTQAGAVETAFNVLAQWAHAATIAEADVNEERGVVRDELRLRYETGSGIINRIFDQAYVEDTPYEGYFTIGTAEGIESITPEMLRDFYETWYVPSNMALIAVGDLPVTELEALTEEYFGPIPAGEAPPEPDKFSPISPEPAYLIATSPSWAYSYMSLDLKIPAWDGATVDGERRWLIETLISLMLDARLKDAYEQGFLSQLDPAKWQAFNYTDGIRFYGTNLRADDLATALGDYWSMVLSLEAAGFSDEDLQQAADVVRTDLQFELDSVGTVQDAEWAGLYVSHFLAGDDIGTVADRVERINTLLAEMRAEELTEHFRSIMSAAAPIVIAVGSDPSEVPTAEEIQAAVEGAAPGPVPERTAEVSALMESPEPVEAGLRGPGGGHRGRLRVDLRQRRHRGVRAHGHLRGAGGPAGGLPGWLVGHGTRRARPDRPAGRPGGPQQRRRRPRPLAGAAPARGAQRGGRPVHQRDGGGLQRLGRGRRHRDHVPDAAPAGDGAAGRRPGLRRGTAGRRHPHLAGRVRPRLDDLDRLHRGPPSRRLRVVQPDRVSRGARRPHARESAGPLPGAPRRRGRSARRRGGRHRPGDRGGHGEPVHRHAARRRGRHVRQPPLARAGRGVVRRDVVLPPDTQSTGVEIYFEAPRDEVNVALDVATAALTTILNARLIAQVREDIGATYSAGTRVSPVLTPEPGVSGLVVASGDPQYIEQIQVTISEILADLVANGPTLDEWAEALAVLNAEYTHEGNADYINAVLRRAHAPDTELPTTKRLFEEVANLEIGDVQALAAALFDLDQRIEIITVLG